VNWYTIELIDRRAPTAPDTGWTRLTAERLETDYDWVVREKVREFLLGAPRSIALLKVGSDVLSALSLDAVPYLAIDAFLSGTLRLQGAAREQWGHWNGAIVYIRSSAFSDLTTRLHQPSKSPMVIGYFPEIEDKPRKAGRPALYDWAVLKPVFRKRYADLGPWHAQNIKGWQSQSDAEDWLSDQSRENGRFAAKSTCRRMICLWLNNPD